MKAGEEDENGQLMVMILGYVALALLVATVVIGISAVYLEHKRLLSLADGASLAAADSYTLGEVTTQGGSPSAVLNPARVRNVAADFIARSPSSERFHSLAVAGPLERLTDPPRSLSSPQQFTRPW
ncbi:Tad domain-containing protein [Arthrobacter sp. MPF02]|uniref:Tad domain-containing protein n=1 Tax=Arthrobacter sp. MPF02 TaxID=3388492 RepID=UPI0039848A67